MTLQVSYLENYFVAVDSVNDNFKNILYYHALFK